MRLPRMTTRRLMVGVAIAAGFSSLTFETKFRSLRAYYLARAHSFDTDEGSALLKEQRCREAIRNARAKVRAIGDWTANLGRRPVGPKPVLDREEETYLRRGEAMVALHVRQARYCGDMKRKYLRAASRPWEPVPPDSPFPE